MSTLFSPETFWLDFVNVSLGVVCGLLLLAVLAACLIEAHRTWRHSQKHGATPMEGPREGPA